MIPHSKPDLGPEEQEAIARTLRSGQIAQGPRVDEFETRFARFLGMGKGVATTSGTTALHLALLAMGVKKGDKVVIPSYVCSSLLIVLDQIRAIPQLVDIRPGSFNLDPEQVKKRLTPKTKAIIAPHMFGFPADMDSLSSLGIPVIEDCAHSIGARHRGRLVGTIGTASIFSFYATKVMTTGEGGMVLSKSEKLLEKIRDLRDFDCKERYKIRFNYKMTDLQAAMGLVQLRKLPFFIRRRKEIKLLYDKAFTGLEFLLTKTDPETDPVYYRYILRIKSGLNLFKRKLLQRGIICSEPVYKPLHRYLDLDPKNFKVTEETFKTSLSLPLYPALSSSEVNRITSAIKTLKFLEPGFHPS